MNVKKRLASRGELWYNYLEMQNRPITVASPGAACKCKCMLFCYVILYEKILYLSIGLAKQASPFFKGYGFT